MTLRDGGARCLQQPASKTALAPEFDAARSSFLFVPSWGTVDAILQDGPTAIGAETNGSAIGYAVRSAGGVFPKWAHVASRYSATRSVLVYLIPDEGLPGAGSRRVWSDFNGTTYSFVLTFDAGLIGLFAHNGTTAAQATWSTTVTAGEPMAIMGTFDGATLSLYVNGQLRATAALSGSLRNVTNGIGLCGNPSGVVEDLEARVSLAWQCNLCLSTSACERLTTDPWRLFYRRVSSPYAGGTNYPVTQTEAASAADTTSCVIGYAPSATEAASAGDVAAAAMAAAVAAIEAASASSAEAAATARQAAITEAATATDTASAAAAGEYSASITEAATAASVEAAVTAYLASIAEAASASDSASASLPGTFSVSIAEAASALDSAAQATAMTLTIAESASAADAANWLGAAAFTGPARARLGATSATAQPRRLGATTARDPSRRLGARTP